MQIYQDTYCKGHIRTELLGIYMSQGKGLETHQGQPQLHIGSDYCIWKAKEESQKTAWAEGQVWHIFWHSTSRGEDAETGTSASVREAPVETIQRLMANTDTRPHQLITAL